MIGECVSTLFLGSCCKWDLNVGVGVAVSVPAITEYTHSHCLMPIPQPQLRHSNRIYSTGKGECQNE